MILHLSSLLSSESTLCAIEDFGTFSAPSSESILNQLSHRPSSVCLNLLASVSSAVSSKNMELMSPSAWCLREQGQCWISLKMVNWLDKKILRSIWLTASILINQMQFDSYLHSNASLISRNWDPYHWLIDWYSCDAVHYSGDVDLALTVTDAFMVGKASGRKVNLLGTFVESPLVWAVAARTERDDVTSIPELLGDNLFLFMSSFLRVWHSILNVGTSISR